MFVVLLIGFAVAMAMQSARVARERDVAEKERAAAQQERETAQRVSAFLVDLFRVSDPSRARGNTITAREVLDMVRSRRYMEAEPLVLGSYPVIEAKMGERSPETRKALQRIVGLYDAWGKPDKAATYRGKLTREKALATMER